MWVDTSAVGHAKAPGEKDVSGRILTEFPTFPETFHSTTLPMDLISLSGYNKGSCCSAGKPGCEPTGQGPSPAQQGTRPGTGMAAMKLQHSPGMSQVPEPLLNAAASQGAGTPTAASSSSSSENSKDNWSFSNTSHLSELSSQEELGFFS